MIAPVIVLVASIPARRRSCERLLDEMTRQTRPPDGVVLVLDGYGVDEGDTAYQRTPVCPLPVIAKYRTVAPRGAGARWRVVEDLPPDALVINLDDDIMTIEAPQLIEALVAAAGDFCAAAAMGRTADGKQAPPGAYSRGALIYGAGCGLTVRARHLFGLHAFAGEVILAGGPDALGLLGDDDALVSAYLWKQKIPIAHAATGNIYPAPNTQESSQTRAHLQRGNDFDVQKRAIRKAIGWPWPVQ
jgi:hypothetical protein